MAGGDEVNDGTNDVIMTGREEVDGTNDVISSKVSGSEEADGANAVISELAGSEGVNRTNCESTDTVRDEFKSETQTEDDNDDDACGIAVLPDGQDQSLF